MSVDIASLLDIREAIERAQSFAAELNYDQFLGDEKTMWSVYSQIIVIGEATNRISQEFQQQHSDVPWRKIISMRHHLVHGYD
ncbi:MAG: HepT-like ribonuclease domain-containing protein, partial [Planctomycetota bacterium]